MSYIDICEAATPGWRWLMYRTWRCAGHGSGAFRSLTYGRRYRVTKVVPIRIEPRQLRLV